MKNKKNIAMAMVAVSTLGAVAPAFADQIESTLVTSVDLAKVNGVKAVWAKVGEKFVEEYVAYGYSQEDIIQEQKNIDALKLYLENKSKQLYGNDNEKKYTIIEKYVPANTDSVNDASVGYDVSEGRRGYLQITVIDNSDVTAKSEVFKVYGIRRDTGFGQGEPDINEQNTVTMSFESNRLIKYNEETGKVEDNILASSEELHKELDKLIYEIRKAGDKITVNKVEDESDKTNFELKIYRGNDQLGLIRLFDTDKMDTELLKNIPASNDFVGHWAEGTIVDGMLNEIVDVSETFRPEDGISRAEFAKIAVNAYGVSTSTLGTTKINFSDVKESSWDYKYIMALATRGYIQGFEGKFRPEDKITREEAAVIVAKLEANVGGINSQAKNIETVSTDKNGNDVHTSVEIKGIEDGKSVSVWADESVKALLDSKVLNGYKENGKTYFKPANDIKRAEALVMMTRNK